MASAKQPKLAAAGSRAPDFRLKRLEGGEVSLRDLITNEPVLLAFFKVTCPVCQFTFPFLERLPAAGTLPVYGISQNGAADTREFLHEFGVTFPILLDEEEDGFPVSGGYGIASVPSLFLVERDGTIGRVTEGWSRAEMEWLGARAGVEVIRPAEKVPEWKPG